MLNYFLKKIWSLLNRNKIIHNKIIKNQDKIFSICSSRSWIFLFLTTLSLKNVKSTNFLRMVVKSQRRIKENRIQKQGSNILTHTMLNRVQFINKSILYTGLSWYLQRSRMSTVLYLFSFYKINIIVLLIWLLSLLYHKLVFTFPSIYIFIFCFMELSSYMYVNFILSITGLIIFYVV